MLIMGFGLLYWSLTKALRTPEGTTTFSSCLYFSGTSFFTLGLGDVAPQRLLARSLSVLEAGMGFGFLAIVISYLPAINQAFSRRETNISLLDARAGSPPTAAEILSRHNVENGIEALTELLHEWEKWCSDLLESHLSFPMLAYFRSQHDNQSWIAALTAILDTSAFAIAGFEGRCLRQAKLTFAIARHAVVDLALVLYAPPREPHFERLSAQDLSAIRAMLPPGLHLRKSSEAEHQLRELRGMYEPYVYSLSERLLMPLPPWILETARPDNWQISAWGPKPTRHF